MAAAELAALLSGGTVIAACDDSGGACHGSVRTVWGTPGDDSTKRVYCDDANGSHLLNGSSSDSGGSSGSKSGGGSGGKHVVRDRRNDGTSTQHSDGSYTTNHIHINARKAYRQECSGNIGVDGMPNPQPNGKGKLSRPQAKALYEGGESVSGNCHVPAYMLAALSYRENTGFSDGGAVTGTDGAMQADANARQRFQPQSSRGGASNPSVSVVTAINFLRDLAYHYGFDYSKSNDRIAAYAMYNGGETARYRANIPAWGYAFDAHGHEKESMWWDGDEGANRSAVYNPNADASNYVDLFDRSGSVVPAPADMRPQRELAA